MMHKRFDLLRLLCCMLQVQGQHLLAHLGAHLGAGFEGLSKPARKTLANNVDTTCAAKQWVQT